MRATVVLLLLANMLTFLWFGWWSPPTAAPRPEAGGDLVALNDSRARGRECFVLQPPPGRGEGERLARRLDDRWPRVDWQPPATRTEYWVHQPPLGDLSDARAAVQRLRRAGFDDAALGTGRGWTNVAVLGAFEDRDRAEARLQKARDKDFDAVVSKRQRELRAGRLMVRASQAPAAPEGHQWVRRDCAG